MYRLILSALSIFFSVCVFSQGAGYVGDWEGKLDIGPGLRIIFHIKEDPATGLKASADSPDQNSFGLVCDTAYVNASGLHIEMRALHAAYAGVLRGDSLIEGTFTQRGPVPLTLKRAKPREAPKRPQSPQTPFPYKSEEVTYGGKSTGLTYGATITIPPGKGPFPAALLITGSGQQNRDEELMGHKTFAVLADALTRNGVVVLRVDDRGIGKSTGNFNTATSGDFAADASASFDYLLSRPEVDRRKAGLVGHSEGGLIAPVVASARQDLDFMILLAAPGIPIRQLMKEQGEAILRSSGVRDSAVSVYGTFYTSLMQTLSSGEDSATAINMARSYMNQWATSTDSSVLSELQLNSPMARMEMFRVLANAARNPWFRYFYRFDPTPYLEKLNLKVLALNGSKDIQVLPVSNTGGLKKALAKSPSKKYDVLIIPGLNHLFQTCTACTIQEYGELEETFSPVALKQMNDWLNSNVK